jgi:hypothetical protein
MLTRDAANVCISSPPRGSLFLVTLFLHFVIGDSCIVLDFQSDSRPVSAQNGAAFCRIMFALVEQWMRAKTPSGKGRQESAERALANR